MYLKEVQGLRVFAALLVAIYHIWFQRVSGGVDAFFVIAGFFVFRSLFKSPDPGWRNVLDQYRRTAARIVPSASVVILATCASFIWFDVDSLWSAQIKSAIAALFFVENWWLALNSVDYLARGDMPSPFQQMWALSVQAQLYFLLPPLLLGAAACARRIGVSRAPLAVVIGALLLIFFGYALLATARNQPFAYFDTFARIWEFLAGALLAACLPFMKLKPAPAKVLGYACLAVLACFAAVIPVATSFPGLAAAVPVLATVGIIVAASNGASLRLLANEPMQRLGELSFTFYLWHWPILMAYWLFNGTEAPGLLQGLGIILLAGILAHVTYLLVERPVRTRASTIGSTATVLLVCAAIMLPAAGITGWWASRYISERDAARQTLARFTFQEPVDDLLPATIIAKADIPNAYRRGCQQGWGEDDPIECVSGNQEGAIEIVLVGGSHSLHWLPALQRIARLEPSLKIISLTKGNCPLTLSAEQLNLAEEDVCLSWSRQVIDRIHQIDPAAVVTLLTTTNPTADHPRERIPPGFRHVWDSMAGIPVIAIRDTPRADFDILACVDRFGAEAERCTIDEASIMTATIMDNMDLPPNVHPVDLLDSFCRQGVCPPVRNGLLVYRDDSHLTATYAESLAPSLHTRLRDLGALPTPSH